MSDKKLELQAAQAKQEAYAEAWRRVVASYKLWANDDGYQTEEDLIHTIGECVELFGDPNLSTSKVATNERIKLVIDVPNIDLMLMDMNNALEQV